MKTRKEAQIFIASQFHDNYKKRNLLYQGQKGKIIPKSYDYPWHYGRMELCELLKFIYEDDVKKPNLHNIGQEK